MKLLIGMFFAAAVAASSQQAPPLDEWHTVQRVCGVLDRVKYAPQKHSAQLQQTNLPFRHVDLELYERQEGAPCCDNLVLAGRARADDDGKFAFRKISPSTYWLAMQFGGRTYSYPLRYERAKHPVLGCDDYHFGFDETAKTPLDRELVVE